MKRPSSFKKSFVLILGMIMMLVASWEYSKSDAVLAQAAESAAIPEQSIRLRILADSDAPADQALKRRVRDAIIASMNEWAQGPQTIDEARATIRERLPELEQIAADVVAEAGFDYAVKAELGKVPFPTKVYGGQVYPAGEYEALRITLGRGLGQNWWCVLFPPLCFVDVAAAETPQSAGAAAIDAEAEGSTEPQVEYRFFLLDLIAGAVEKVRGWF